MSTLDLVRRDAEVFGTNMMLFLFLPLALSLALTRLSKWGFLPLAVATSVPAAWLAVYLFHLSRENGDNQMIAVGITALALLGWLILLMVSLGVAVQRLRLRRRAVAGPWRFRERVDEPTGDTDEPGDARPASGEEPGPKGGHRSA